jgi:hypothetical protein
VPILRKPRRLFLLGEALHKALYLSTETTTPSYEKGVNRLAVQIFSEKKIVGRATWSPEFVYPDLRHYFAYWLKETSALHRPSFINLLVACFQRL